MIEQDFTPTQEPPVRFTDPSERAPARRFHVPRWQLLTDLDGTAQPEMTRRVRRHNVRLLVNVATLLIRKELHLHDADEKQGERTIYWEPVQEVLRYLGISRSKLSAYMRELTGLSLSHTVDCVRVVGVKTKMRDALRAFLKSFRETPLPRGERGRGEGVTGDAAAPSSGAKAPPSPHGGEGSKWDLWKALRASRRWPEFSHGTWAAEYGFSSYTRFYRACMVVYGCSPHQLELKLLDELLKEETGEASAAPPERHAATLEEVNAQLKTLLPDDPDFLTPEEIYRAEVEESRM